MAGTLSPEVRHLWNTVKYQLSGNGLMEVGKQYPELEKEADEILAFDPVPIQNARLMKGPQGNKLIVGAKLNYTGKGINPAFIDGRKVIVAETPLASAIEGLVAVQTWEGFIFHGISPDDLTWEE